MAAGGLAAMWTLVGDRADLLYTGGFLVEALLVAVVIAAVVQPRARCAGSILVDRLAALGSAASPTGVYLYHWPVYVALDEERLGLDGYALFTVRIVVTFVIAALSYYLLEMPIREGRLPKHRVRILAPSAAVAVLAGVFLADRGRTACEDRGLRGRRARADRPAGHGRRGAAQRDRAADRVMLVGDSIAGSLAPGVGRRASDRRLLLLRRDGGRLRAHQRSR